MGVCCPVNRARGDYKTQREHPLDTDLQPARSSADKRPSWEGTMGNGDPAHGERWGGDGILPLEFILFIYFCMAPETGGMLEASKVEAASGS